MIKETKHVKAHTCEECGHKIKEADLTLYKCSYCGVEFMREVACKRHEDRCVQKGWADVVDIHTTGDGSDYFVNVYKHRSIPSTTLELESNTDTLIPNEEDCDIEISIRHIPLNMVDKAVKKLKDEWHRRIDILVKKVDSIDDRVKDALKE